MGHTDPTKKPLTPNGLIVPDEFPTAEYELIFKIISSGFNSKPLYEHFAGAWNALAYRFCGTMDHRDAFIEYIQKQGSTPPPQERYLQERVLFDFFSSAFSTFESAFYGLYTIGAFTSPAAFPLSSPKDQQKVSPSSTRNAYIDAFPGDPILPVFDSIFSDSKFQQLREVRNILTHRSAPGRRMYVGIGSDDAPSTEWKLNNIPINETIVTGAVDDLSRLLTEMLVACRDFIKRNNL